MGLVIEEAGIPDIEGEFRKVSFPFPPGLAVVFGIGAMSSPPAPPPSDCGRPSWCGSGGPMASAGAPPSRPSDPAGERFRRGDQPDLVPGPGWAPDGLKAGFRAAGAAAAMISDERKDLAS